MLNAARVQGKPMMVIAMRTPAIIQATAIHRPPKMIHNTLSRSENGDIVFLRDSRAMRACTRCRAIDAWARSRYCGAHLPARERQAGRGFAASDSPSRRLGWRCRGHEGRLACNIAGTAQRLAAGTPE